MRRDISWYSHHRASQWIPWMKESAAAAVTAPHCENIPAVKPPEHQRLGACMPHYFSSSNSGFMMCCLTNEIPSVCLSQSLHFQHYVISIKSE